MINKSTKNLLYSTTNTTPSSTSTHGQIGILPTFVSATKISGTTICYYALLTIDNPSQSNSSYSSPSSPFIQATSQPVPIPSSTQSETHEGSLGKYSQKNTGNTSNSNQASNIPTKAQDYIICFICEVQNDEGFALYLFATIFFCFFP